jgi:hypothetical protein
LGRLSFRAIFAGIGLGLVTELIGAIVLVLVFVLVAGVLMLNGWPGPGTTPHAFTEAFTKSGGFTLAKSIGVFVLSMLSTAVGGYVAARLAPRQPYLNAGVAAVIGNGLGIGLDSLFLGAQALLEKALSFQGGADIILEIPAALLGAYLATRRSEARGGAASRGELGATSRYAP